MALRTLPSMSLGDTLAEAGEDGWGDVFDVGVNLLAGGDAGALGDEDAFEAMGAFEAIEGDPADGGRCREFS